LSTDGSSVSISVDASINDGGVVVDFTALIFLNAQLLDGTTHLPKGSDHDEHTNPNFPNTDDSSQWPLGQYSNTTLTVSFPAASLSVGDYIHLHLSASGENDSASETDDDECLFTVTIMP
jgi:hypothetical protein